MPTFLYQKFHMSLSMAGLNATAYLQIASVIGVFTGGLLADSLIKKIYGGRLLTQSFGLLCGVPFLFLTGYTTSVPWLILAMIGFGYFKGLYDANIFAGLYDASRSPAAEPQPVCSTRSAGSAEASRRSSSPSPRSVMASAHASPPPPVSIS